MQALPPKKEVALALLQRSTVFIHLDPRREEVRVPPWFKKQPQLVLQIGLNMAVPIRDLEVDDEGISCTLSFNRTPHFCMLPWTAIYALVGEDGRGMVWPDDVPAEVAAQANAKGTQQQAPRKKPHLRAVGEPEEADTDEVQEPETPRADASPEATESTAADEPSAAEASAPSPAAEERKSARPALAALPNDEPEPEATEAEAADHAETASSNEEPAAEEKQDGKRKLPPYLRVVK